MRTKFAEGWYARSNRAGDHMCHHQAKWDQPPLVPPVDKEVAKYMYGGWGKIREGVGWRKGGEGERKRTGGEGERAGRARLAGQA